MVWMQNQTYVKAKNTRTLLDLISQEQPVSRTQITEMTELSAASVTRIVGALVALGLVREEGHAQSEGRGRKAHILCTCPDGIYSAGICIEPTKLLLNINDFHQRSVYRHEIDLDPSCAYTPKALAGLAREMYRGIDRSILKDWSKVRVMGVSVPGLVDSNRGVVLASDQFRWENADLRTPFEQAIGLPVWIENDVKACLIGEKARRGIPRKADVVYLLIGTGVGVAATSNGKLVRGYNNRAGEVEHLDLSSSMRLADTLQTHLVGERILDNVRSAYPSIASLKELMDAYRQNLGFARLQVADFEQYLRLVLSMIDSFYDPESIILGGSTLFAFVPAISELLSDPRISIGEDYETACVLGACIGAEGYALDVMLES